MDDGLYCREIELVCDFGNIIFCLVSQAQMPFTEHPEGCATSFMVGTFVGFMVDFSNWYFSMSLYRMDPL